MTYQAEITFRIGSEREFTFEESFDDLQGAVNFLNHNATGMGLVVCYINNKRIQMKDGHCLGDDGDLLCTNEIWHNLFADENERIKSL